MQVPHADYEISLSETWRLVALIRLVLHLIPLPSCSTILEPQPTAGVTDYLRDHPSAFKTVEAKGQRRQSRHDTNGFYIFDEQKVIREESMRSQRLCDSTSKVCDRGALTRVLVRTPSTSSATATASSARSYSSSVTALGGGRSRLDTYPPASH